MYTAQYTPLSCEQLSNVVPQLDKRRNNNLIMCGKTEEENIENLKFIRNNVFLLAQGVCPSGNVPVNAKFTPCHAPKKVVVTT